MCVCDLFVAWGIISRGQISTKIGFLFTHLHNGTHTHTHTHTHTQRKYRNTFSQLVAVGVHNTNLIGSNFRTIARPAEGNCFYRRLQTGCKYFNKPHQFLKKNKKTKKGTQDSLCSLEFKGKWKVIESKYKRTCLNIFLRKNRNEILLDISKYATFCRLHSSPAVVSLFHTTPAWRRCDGQVP